MFFIGQLHVDQPPCNTWYLMFSTSTDTHWEEFGRLDPYYGVVSHAEYHSASLSGESIAQFFGSGEQHVTRVIDEITRYIDPDFAPSRTLDFGCGVGRVAIPLARKLKHVVGLDVSAGMLARAAEASQSQGVRNLDLVRYRGEIPAIRGQFDFIHSALVFQHIRPRRGMKIFRRLLAALADDGVGAIQFVFKPTAPPIHRLVNAAAHLPVLAAAASFVRHGQWRYPRMEMHCYSLNHVFAELFAAGCRVCHVALADDGDYLGAMLLFRKQRIVA